MAGGGQSAPWHPLSPVCVYRKLRHIVAKRELNGELNGNGHTEHRTREGAKGPTNNGKPQSRKTHGVQILARGGSGHPLTVSGMEHTSGFQATASEMAAIDGF